MRNIVCKENKELEKTIVQWKLVWIKGQLSKAIEKRLGKPMVIKCNKLQRHSYCGKQYIIGKYDY